MKVGTQQMNKPVGGPGLASPGVDVHIRIQDENDNNPVFVPSELPLTLNGGQWPNMLNTSKSLFLGREMGQRSRGLISWLRTDFFLS